MFYLKERLFSAALAALLAVTTLPALAQSFLTNGLVAYYPFTGNAVDASGNGNNGTVIGAVPCPDRFGNASSAYSFNGSSSYISFTAPPTNQTNNVTLSAWINPASTNQAAMAVVLGYDDPGLGNGFALGIAGGGLSAGNKVSGFLGGVTWVNSGAVYPATNVWYHVVMVQQSGVTLFYVNGVPTAITTTNNAITPTGFRIGSLDGIWFFNGKIDDVRVYNRALSSFEVSELYNAEGIACTPHAATATATVTSGFVTSATMVNYGCGYTNTPAVVITGGGGSGAMAMATVTNGSVSGITILATGSGYTNAPQIIIGSPPFVPTVSIAVSQVSVTQHVVLGLNYILQSSADLINWTNTGPEYTAQSEYVTTNFTVGQYGKFFRVVQVP